MRPYIAAACNRRGGITISTNFADLDARSDNYAVAVVDRVLAAAFAAGASDVHLERMASSISIRMRVSGSLVAVGELPEGHTTSVLGRLKALARLITYRSDIPQEGRLVLRDGNVEARVGTLPTIHGERAVIRLCLPTADDWLPVNLGLPDRVQQAYEHALQRPSGVILITGPAGSGKTTTAYAGLRYVLQQSSEPRSLVSLEDPIESEVVGVAQSQINAAAGYGWSEGLNAALRQDCEVLFIGEIRDSAAAAVAFQAAMTGQLVLSTMHARSVVDAVSRLLDMQLPAQHLRSGLELLVCQRLIRRNCECRRTCSSLTAAKIVGDTHAETTAEWARERGDGAAVENAVCPRCGGLGYRGRVALAELMPPIDGELSRAVLQDADAAEIQRVCSALGMQDLCALAAERVAVGQIDASQVARYL